MGLIACPLASGLHPTSQLSCCWVMHLCLLLAAILLPPAPEAWAQAVAEPPAGELMLEVRPAKDRVYVHEAVAVSVTLLVGQVPVRNIRYPRLAGVAFGVAEFAPPRQASIRRDGREFTIHEFMATLVPREAGTIDLGPAELECDLLTPADGAAAFFGGGESRLVTLRSAPVRLQVRALPRAGRPADFTGAVGRFTVSRRVAPMDIRSGDPVTVTTEVRGVGNFDSLSCAPIELPGVRSYPPRARKSANRLSCEQVLVSGDAPLEIPAARLSYFDPALGAYRTRESLPIRLTMRSGTMDKAAAGAAAPVRSPLLMPKPPSAARIPGWVGLATAGLILILALGLLARYLGYKAPDQQVLRASETCSVRDWLLMAEQALAAGDPIRFHAAVFRTLQAQIGTQFGLPQAGITGDVINRLAGQAGVDEARLDNYAQIFMACDRARYGPPGLRSPEMDKTLERLRKVTQ